MLYEFLSYQFAELVRAASIVCLFLMLERLHPVEAQPRGAKAFNIVYALVAYVAVTASAYLITQTNLVVLQVRYETVVASNFVSQSLDAAELTVRIIVYLLLVDFLSYWRHRAMHAWPLLWRFHKFHHSDTSMNTTTARRDHWLNEFLQYFAVNLPALALFGVLDVPSYVLFAYIAYPFFTHANIRLGFGPLTPVINGPQLHRIHHSRLPEHADSNFAGIFPIFDIMFGTYCAPERGRFAPTGLVSGEVIDRQWEAHMMPFRRSPADPIR